MERKTRRSVPPVQRAALTFLSERDAERAAKLRKDTARDAVQEFTLPDPDDEEQNPHEVRVDENGHRYYDFEEPVEINGVQYKALRNQRTVSTFLDLSRVEAFFSIDNDELNLDEIGRRSELRAKVLKSRTEYYYDPEELYRLNQQGELTDEEIDSFVATSVTWKLTVEKA